MRQSLQITAANLDPELLDLPWETPLEEWPESVLAALPRGISRHVVRFVNLGGRVIAVKEIGETVAYHEYQLLRDLNRLGAPSVIPTAVITGRKSPEGEELTPALVTEHLQFSLPYRAVISQSMRPETAERLINSIAVLLVRLHLLGFYWGDVSLSNTLFRRDADAFSGYLVDAETGELHPSLTSGQRNYDVDLARTNIIGELMDLQAGGMLAENSDAIEIGDRIHGRYHELWDQLTAEEVYSDDERWRITNRIRKLNDLGFDVGEVSLKQTPDGTKIILQPKVVDAGHHHRQIMRLTGLDVQEQQARRMLNDLATYRAVTGQENQPIELVAHQWLTEVFEPTVRSVPPEYSAKLQPAQIFHEIQEHRWFLAEQRGADVPLEEATQSYIDNILATRRDEALLLDLDPNDEHTLED